MLDQGTAPTRAGAPDWDDAAPRILSVAKDRYPPFRVDIVEMLSRRLSESGLACDWLMKREHPGPSDIIQASRNERFLVLGNGGGGAIANARIIFRVLKDILRRKYRLVQVRDLPITALAFLIITRFAATPFVYWMSFPQAEAPGHRARNPEEDIPAWRRPIMRVYSFVATTIYYRIVLKGADHVIVQSDRMKADLVLRGIESTKMTPIPMGVSVEVYNPTTIVPTDDPRLRQRASLVYVGTCSPARRIDILVRALAALVRQGCDAVLVLVGDVRPEDATRISIVARQEAVTDRLLFTGHLPLSKALGYVRRATVCLAPCPKDPLLLPGTPTKLVEYLAMGRPVVANDHPDQEHVLQSSGAGLIAPLSADGFADAIFRLLADVEEREQKAARGPGWVATHRSYDALSKTLFSVYATLLTSVSERAGVNDRPVTQERSVSAGTGGTRS